MKYTAIIFFLIISSRAFSGQVEFSFPGGVNSRCEMTEINCINYVSQTDLNDSFLSNLRKSGYIKINEIRVVPGSFFIFLEGESESYPIQVYTPVIDRNSTIYVPIQSLLNSIIIDKELKFSFSPKQIKITHPFKPDVVVQKSIKIESPKSKNIIPEIIPSETIIKKDKKATFYTGFLRRSQIFIKSKANSISDPTIPVIKGLDKDLTRPADFKHYKTESDVEDSDLIDSNSIDTEIEPQFDNIEDREIKIEEIEPIQDTIEANQTEIEKSEESDLKSEPVLDETKVTIETKSDLRSVPVRSGMTDKEPNAEPSQQQTKEVAQPDNNSSSKVTIGKSSTPMPGMKLPSVSKDTIIDNPEIKLTPNKYVIPKKSIKIK